MSDHGKALDELRAELVQRVALAPNAPYARAHVQRWIDALDAIRVEREWPRMPQMLRIGRFQFPVTSLLEARAIYERERDASGEGASTWPRGRVGSYEISYNGRVWLDGNAVSL